MKAIIGRKLGMTQMFGEDGSAVPITVLEAGPCTVTQIKTVERDGYSALQIGYGTRKEKNLSLPLKGHMGKAGKGYFQVLREVHTDRVGEFQLGQGITTEIFHVGEKIDVIGTSKGKGFTGTIKRWGFSRGPVTHGCKNIREPGSTGMATFPGRVLKGKRMAGQKGNKRVTVMNLQIIDIRPEENLMFVKGAVPGAGNGIILIRKTSRGR